MHTSFLHYRRVRVFVLLLLLATFDLALAQAILPQAPGRTAAEQAYARGLAALNQNDLTNAELAFKASLGDSALSTRAALGLADVAVRRGKLDEVKSWLERAAGTSPNSADVENAWGRYHFARGDYEQAEARYKRAVTIDPRAFRPRVDLADLYMTKLGKPQQAVEAYREAIKADPIHAGARFGLGMALAATGDNKGALVELQSAARMEPSNPLPLRGIGQVHLAERRFNAAVDSFTKAISMQPTLAGLYVDRAEAYGRSGDDTKALADYDQALKLSPKFADAHVGKGMLLQRQNRLDEAQAAYLAAVKINDKHALAYNNLAWMAAERKTQLNDALAWATKATQAAPNAGPYFDTLGWVHRARGEHDRATTALERAVKLAPAYAEAHYHLGIVYSESDKRALAAAALKRALTVDPNFAGADDAKRRLAALGG